MSRFEYDDENGILEYYVSGYHDAADARRLALEVRSHVIKARQKYGKLKFVSISEGEILPASQDAMEEYQGAGKETFNHPDDKLAYVISSALVRMQIVRLSEGFNTKAFPTIEEARAWLVS